MRRNGKDEMGKGQLTSGDIGSLLSLQRSRILQLSHQAQDLADLLRRVGAQGNFRRRCRLHEVDRTAGIRIMQYLDSAWSDGSARAASLAHQYRVSTLLAKEGGGKGRVVRQVVDIRDQP